MNIVVTRKVFKEDYTIGVLTINGVKFCDTLEDKYRGLDSRMPLSRLKSMKVYGKTAIPTGTYKVKSYFWPKYRKYYPLLENVPAYSGILVHSGVTHEHTNGCVLIGENKAVGKLFNGEKYVRELTTKIQECERRGEPVTITIK